MESKWHILSKLLNLYSAWENKKTVKQNAQIETSKLNIVLKLNNGKR